MGVKVARLYGSCRVSEAPGVGGVADRRCRYARLEMNESEHHRRRDDYYCVCNKRVAAPWSSLSISPNPRSMREKNLLRFLHAGDDGGSANQPLELR